MVIEAVLAPAPAVHLLTLTALVDHQGAGHDRAGPPVLPGAFLLQALHRRHQGV